MNNDFSRLFITFKQQYELTNPPPVYSVRALLGWQFILSLVWAGFAVVMVASQTATEFHTAKIMSGMNPTVALVASVAVLGAIEGGIVLGAAIKAATKRNYDERLINLAIALSVGISIIAGINSTIGIIESVDQNLLYWLRLGLVFILGIGGSLVAWAAGEVVGAQLAKAFLDRDHTYKEFQETLEEYNKGLLNAWRSSPEYVLAKADVREDAQHVRSRLKQQSIEPSNGKVIDYRHLTDEQKQGILHMSTNEIMDTFGVRSIRTAQHWKSRAVEDFATQE